ncbi:MAG: SGNH/GDSL hydrolase family protein [Pseudomonadota bacterium]
MNLGFERIAYFGDSLTDSDEFFAASSAVAFFGLPPTAAGYAGQFSNGDVYSDLVPGLLGVEGGDALNYAVGGAQVLTDRTIGEVLAGSGLIRPDATEEDLGFRIDFKGQIARFLEDEAGSDFSSTAVSVFVGFNDFDDFAPTSPETAFEEVVAYGVQLASTVIADTAQLVGAGAGTVILHTLGDPSIFPGTQNDDPGLQALATGLSQTYNAVLLDGAAQLEALGADVIVVDFGALFAEVEADFRSFGFQTLDDTAVLGSNGLGGPNPAIADIPLDQVAFFDDVHPTAALHGVIAGFQAASIAADDVVVGEADGDCIHTGRGDDLVLASGGNDFVVLGRGADIAFGGLGDDIVKGGRGADLIGGGDGADLLKGGRGADIIADGLGDDIVFGGRGADLLIDGQGDDALFGGRGADAFVFTEGSLRGEEDGGAFISGGKGVDTLILRVEDADALEIEEFGRFSVVEDLGLTFTDIEKIVVVEGTDLSEEDFYDTQFATADLWNFV